MRTLIPLALAVSLLAPASYAATPRATPERAWRPFYTKFRAAVRARDRRLLRELMAGDFYFSPGEGEGDGDARDEALAFYDARGSAAWSALEKTLRRGVVRDARGNERPNRFGRVAPPAANDPRAARARSFDWYAVFEYREGRWLWTAFAECCD